MGYFKTPGARGSELEEMINTTNELYRRNGVALVQKIPTPITPLEMDEKKGRIKLAYFDKKSTVDYIGIAQGVGIAFDAKETLEMSMPLKNIHEHQVEFLIDFKKQKGEGFFIFYYKAVDKLFIVPIEKYIELLNKCKEEDRKSISYKEFDERYELHIEKGTYINYLNTLNNFL